MRSPWKIAGIALLVAVLGVATVGVVAFAQDAKDSSTSPFDFAAKFREAIAGILGISVDKYDAAVEQAQKQVVDEAVSEGWLTEDQAEALQWRLDQQPGMGPWGGGKGFGLFGRGMGGWGISLTSIAADKLDVSLSELLTALQDGKTIADLAKEKGVDTQTIVDAYVAQVKKYLDQAVSDGSMTQKQADYQLEKIKTSVTDQLDSTWKGSGRGGGRHGGMMGFPGMGGF